MISIDLKFKRSNVVVDDDTIETAKSSLQLILK